jgi:glycosyltransferase involved in cell wall biosynthesis
MGTPVARGDAVASRLRVLHAAPYLWSGAGRVITDLLDSQRERHTVALVTSPRSGELHNWPAYERRVTASGIRHGRIDLFHREGTTFWPAVRQLARVIQSFKPDVIHTHAGTPTAIASLARGASSHPDTPIVSHFYSWGVGRPAWMNTMDLWAFSTSDRVVCSAFAYRDVLLRGGIARRRLRLIPWGLPTGTFASNGPRPSQAPIVGTLGRIERRKGQLDLVRAFARLHRLDPRLRLEIVGPVAEEVYAAEIREAVDGLKLAGVVTLTGHVAEPMRYLRRWTTYVSLSSDEGQGLAVLEAMANAVPVVALNAAGVEDYLTHERTGLVARSRRAGHVADLVQRLLDDSGLARRVAARARAMVARRYSWSRTVEQIDDI